MFKLMPLKEKKRLRADYRKRRLTVFFALVSALSPIAIILILPSYLFLNIEKNFFEDSIVSQKETVEQLVDPEVFGKLQETSNLVESLLPHTQDAFFSDLISKVLDEKTPSISITNIFFEKKMDNGFFLSSVSGISEDRSSLLEFSNRIRSQNIFTEVNVPIESFTRDENINFTIEIKGDINKSEI